MSVEMLSDQVFITENVDAATEISSILKENMDPDTFKRSALERYLAEEEEQLAALERADEEASTNSRFVM
eukprot:jgi/Tetstr1/457999/TSEL_044510.t1